MVSEFETNIKVFIVILGLSNNYTLALFLCASAMFSKSFHNFGTALNAMDIAPKHSGSVYGILNTIGSTSGKLPNVQNDSIVIVCHITVDFVTIQL